MPLIKRKPFYPKSHDKYYHSPSWRFRAKNHKAANSLCYYCSIKPIPIATPGLICDHQLPRSLFPELSEEDSNLRTACRQCDQRKRNVERKANRNNCLELLRIEGFWMD